MKQPGDNKKRMIRGLRNGIGEIINVPPRKKRAAGQTLRLTFVLTGTVPSKKNMQVPAINKKQIAKIIRSYDKITDNLVNEVLSVKSKILNSQTFQDWEEWAGAEIHLQSLQWVKKYKKYNFTYPIKKASISIYHYWADNNIRDNSNKMESINDLLVKQNIICDDTWATLSPVLADADCYKGEIRDHVTEITVTAYSW